MNETKIRLCWWACLVAICSLGITYQIKTAHKPPKQLPVPLQPLGHARVLPPLQNPVVACSSSPKCNLLAEAVVFEARGEPTKGQIAVAHVILNRKKDPRWGNSIRDVIHQPKQFSYLQDKHKQTKPTREDWQRAYHVAYNVLKCVSDVFHKCEGTQWEDPTNKAVFYHTKKVKPRLSTKRVIKTASIGRHVFFKTIE